MNMFRIFDIILVFKSEQAIESLSYTVSITQWKSDQIELLFNFSDPLLVSSEVVKDEILIRLKQNESFS